MCGVPKTKTNMSKCVKCRGMFHRTCIKGAAISLYAFECVSSAVANTSLQTPPSVCVPHVCISMTLHVFYYQNGETLILENHIAGKAMQN